jgi:hypothetical protein
MYGHVRLAADDLNVLSGRARPTEILLWAPGQNIPRPSLDMPQDELDLLVEKLGDRCANLEYLQVRQVLVNNQPLWKNFYDFGTEQMGLDFAAHGRTTIELRNGHSRDYLRASLLAKKLGLKRA